MCNESEKLPKHTTASNKWKYIHQTQRSMMNACSRACVRVNLCVCVCVQIQSIKKQLVFIFDLLFWQSINLSMRWRRFVKSFHRKIVALRGLKMSSFPYVAWNVDDTHFSFISFYFSCRRCDRACFYNWNCTTWICHFTFKTNTFKHTLRCASSKKTHAHTIWCVLLQGKRGKAMPFHSIFQDKLPRHTRAVHQFTF